MKTLLPYGNQQGAALVISLMFVATLSLLGATAVVLTTTDIQIGDNYKKNTQGFFDADAGINYGLAMIEAGLKASPQTFTLPSSVGSTTTLSYTVPSGFSFSISNITKIGSNAYSFTSTGTDPATANAKTILKATFERDGAIEFAAFGDKKLDLKNNAVAQSYKSSSSDPTENDPSDASYTSTHESDIGSNDWLRTSSGSSIDGSGVLGEQADGSPTTNSIGDTNDFYGTTPLNVGRVDPDPLGVNSGGEYDPTTYSAVNDNGLATGLVGNTINGPATLVGKSGGANYYLTSITLDNAETLTVDISAGDVRVFITGAIDLKNGSNVVMSPATYDATKFAIFSNSTSKVSIKNSADFIGLIYAPYSTNVDIMNGADFYGAVWGGDVELKNSGDIYYDSALKDKYLSNNLTQTTWEEVRS